MAKAPQVSPPKKEEEKDVVVKASESAVTALARTGENVKAIPTLVSETVDALEAEAQVKHADDKLDTLTLEQLDHKRTLAKALGLGDEPDNDKLMAEATKRAERLKDKTRDTSKDEQIESIPATWTVNPTGKGNIHAVNTITGRIYEGPAAGLVTAEKE